ncbi:cytochrome P450 [Gordonia sp. DT30]|uniref:cytochrome P450 n=1 Tax=Gordonia sp. DT30 TaxID=3416546 RepID=UPI003CEA2E8D
MTTRPPNVPEQLVVDYDAFGTETPEELLAKAEEWRKLGPVVWTDQNHGHWVVLGTPEVRVVLSDPRKFSSSKPGQGITLTRTERELHVPIEMDGVDHREYRKILMPLFTPARVRVLEDQARRISGELLDDMVKAEECDIVADFARPLASAMFLSLVDWPLDDRHKLEVLVEQELNPPGATREEKAAAKGEAVKQLAAYCRERIEIRRRAPADDMTSTILNATLADGSPIPENRLIPMMVLLCLAGLDTTQSVLSRSLDYLGRNQEAQAEFRDNLDLLPTMIEELLRWNTPAVPNRTAMEDFELGGVQIVAGDTVQCLLQAANRDEDEFPDAWSTDFTRTVNRHVAFSVGPHKCIGSALARVILNAALDEFHTRIHGYHVVDSKAHIGAVWGMNNVRMSLTTSREPATV